uniref:competence type IV pilus major pilin ComGC n=1 Tax=Candidatus Enterococcus willemsii TaxID=1857215 RepID=UPI00403EFE25
MKKRKHHAFTLIEMTIVLLIVSILILVFVPNLSTQKEKATDTGNNAVVKSVETQLELYELEHGQKMTEAEMEKAIPERQLEIYRKHKK